MEQLAEPVEREVSHGSMQPPGARPGHPRESLLWTGHLHPQVNDVRVRRPSTGGDGRVHRIDGDPAPHGRRHRALRSSPTPIDPHPSTYESVRRYGPVGHLGGGSIPIGNDLPSRDRLKPSRSVSSDYAYPNSSPSHGAGSRQVCLWGGRTGYQESTENVIDATRRLNRCGPFQGVALRTIDARVT